MSSLRLIDRHKDEVKSLLSLKISSLTSLIYCCSFIVSALVLVFVAICFLLSGNNGITPIVLIVGAIFCFTRFLKYLRQVKNPIVAAAYRDGIWVQGLGILPWEAIEDIDLPAEDISVRNSDILNTPKLVYDFVLKMTEPGAMLILAHSESIRKTKNLQFIPERRQLRFVLRAPANHFEKKPDDLKNEFKLLQREYSA